MSIGGVSVSIPPMARSGRGGPVVPTKDGKLSDEEKKIAVDRLNGFEAANGKELTCDVCATTLWVLNDYVLGMPSDSPLGPFGARFRTPALGLICTGCGQMKTFSAVRMGIKPLLEADIPPETGGESNGD